MDGHLDVVTTNLPPLPVLPGEGSAYRYQPPGESIIDRLTAEHDALTEMCERLRLRPSRKDSSVLCAMMCRHLSAERQYLYPTALKVLGTQAEPVVAAILKTDQQLESDLDILLWSPSAGELWDEALTRAQSYLREHSDRCATKLLAPLRSHLGHVELVRLGNRLEIAQEAAPSRPHPRLPRHAPWNKLTDAVAGAVDKVRDTVTGRTTFLPHRNRNEEARPSLLNL